MYFPIGWPSFYNSHKHTGLHDALKAIRFNRSRSLFVTLSDTVVYLWKNQPRLLLSTWRREEKSVHDAGVNKCIFWNPDSSVLAVLTDQGFIILLDLFEISKEYLYYLEPVNCKHPVEQLQKNGILKIELNHKVTVSLKGQVTSASPRSDELFITTNEGWIYRLSWSGNFISDLAIQISDLMFCIDLETPTIGSPLAKSKDLFIIKIECSPILGGFGIILSDGRGGFLTSSTAESKTEDIVGIFAKDLTNAVSLAINIKYQIIVFGQSNGQAVAYCFDDLTGGLVVSHSYVLSKKDYPDKGANAGSIIEMRWTPDGGALATLWSKHGIAVWSVFGTLLMCVQHAEQGDIFYHTLMLADMDWGAEGYELLLIPDSCNNVNEQFKPGDIMEIKFVKSAVTVNPCMSNRQHLILQGKDSVYLNLGDAMLQSNDSGTFETQCSASYSMHFGNKHWQTFQLPQSYLGSNTPIRYAVVDSKAKYIAVAGAHGYAHFSLARRKWKLFGNETQEHNVTCRGGMVWWNCFLIVGCYNFYDSVDEIRIHNQSLNLDLVHCVRFTVTSPIFLINMYNNTLIVYCSDCSVTFYELSILGNDMNVAGVSAVKVSETSLIEYVVHPITVTSLGLTCLKNEQQSVDMQENSHEAPSLIANVAGRLLMLQKERLESERSSKKIYYLTPLCLASCVENFWYMVNPKSSKQHLAETLWLGCGAQGMQAWLPLFPTCRPLVFLSKRIMLRFDLQLYPLAVLFEDAVILGIGCENLGVFNEELMSPVQAGSSLLPYFSLERTTQVYLPQILKHLLRRNLGVHALDIARSCTGLPYFAHVLELMLHEVLEKEATASNPIPDPLLPRVVAFIQEFPEFLETVCHCARKTEVALWPHLFSVVGNPIDLFKSCYSTGKLEIAASYLLILQSLESPMVSRQHATLLLDAALERKKLELARDLVRFLRVIGKGENESPPRTPSAHPGLQYKGSFHQNLTFSSSNLDDSMTAPVIMQLQRQSSRSSLPPHNQTRSSSLGGKERSSSIKEKPLSLKLNKRDGSDKVLNKSFSMDSCEDFYIEMILCRYARGLLSSYALLDLGRFSTKLQFDLVTWLTKERARAACIDKFISAFSALHEQFDWPFPEVSSIEKYSKVLSSQNCLLHQNDCYGNEVTAPPTPSNDTVVQDIKPGDIVARLVSMKEDSNDDINSDTMSHSTFDDFSCMEFSDIQKLQQNTEALKVPTTSQEKLKYLLQIFSEARCLDWVIVIGMMLFDTTAVKLVTEKIASLKDVSVTKMDLLFEQLQELSDWLETHCLAYKPILNTIIRDCQTLYTAILDEPLSQDISKDQTTIEDLISSSQSISVDKKDSISSQTDLQKVEAEKESACVMS